MKANIAMVPVPADGDCLAWSLRLFLQDRSCDAMTSFSGKAAEKTMLLVRKTLKHMWIDASTDPFWQIRFSHSRRLPAAPDSPKRKRKNRCLDPEYVDLVTPEKVPAKKAHRFRADGANVAPGFEPKTSSPTLRGPKQSRLRKVLEPEVPDFAEVLEQERMKAEPEVQPEWRGFLDEMNEDHDDDEQQEKPKRREYYRCKSLGQPNNLAPGDIVKRFLAKKSADYGPHKAYHNRKAPVRRAKLCDVGGYLNFRLAPQIGAAPKCEICQAFLKWKKVTPDMVLEAVQNPEQTKKAEAVAEVENPINEDAEAAGERDGEDAEEAPEVDPFVACKQLVDKYSDEVELLVHQTAQGKILFCRCKLCTSGGQPNGKVFRLGPCRINDVRHFLCKHLDNATHSRKRQERLEKKEEEETKEPQKVKCDGP